jgi:hypothetical protein
MLVEPRDPRNWPHMDDNKLASSFRGVRNCRTKTTPCVEKETFIGGQTARLTLGFRVQQLGWNG